MLKEFEEITSFFLSNRKLERSGNGNKNMQHSNQILISSNFSNDWLKRNPCFILMSNYNADNLFVQLYQFVALGTTYHCDNKNLLDLLFFFCIDLKLFWFPASFHCVFQLNQSSLFDCLVNIYIIDNFH